MPDLAFTIALGTQPRIELTVPQGDTLDIVFTVLEPAAEDYTGDTMKFTATNPAGSATFDLDKEGNDASPDFTIDTNVVTVHMLPADTKDIVVANDVKQLTWDFRSVGKGRVIAGGILNILASPTRP